MLLINLWDLETESTEVGKVVGGKSGLNVIFGCVFQIIIMESTSSPPLPVILSIKL